MVINMKKIISLVLILILLFQFSLLAFANNEVTLTVTGESVYVGEEFKIQLLISDNSRMSGAVIDINYDSRMLEYISAEEGAILDSNANISIKKIDEDSSKIRFTYLAPNSSVTSEGVIMILTFKAMPSATGETDLTLSIPSAGDFVTEDMEKISYKLVNSKIKITNTSVEASSETESTSESATESTLTEESASQQTTEPQENNYNKANNDLLPMIILFVIGLAAIAIGVIMLISTKKKDD